MIWILGYFVIGVLTGMFHQWSSSVEDITKSFEDGNFDIEIPPHTELIKLAYGISLFCAVVVWPIFWVSVLYERILK